MELKQSKISSGYQLARVVKAEPSERDGLVRDVDIAYLPKNILKNSAAYTPGQFTVRPVAVQNLVLLATAKEVDQKFWEYNEEDGDEQELCVEATLPLEDKPGPEETEDETGGQTEGRTIKTDHWETMTGGLRSRAEKRRKRATWTIPT